MSEGMQSPGVEGAAAAGAAAGKPGERFTFFWKSDSPFSQWYIGVPFVVDGRQYVTTEQYMMVGKALLFGDEETAARIMATSSPREQKALGRKVRRFEESVWLANRERIVAEGNRAKFTQDTSAGTTLVEASPLDRIWGIGLAAEDPAAAQRSSWRGLNLLGKVLTQLRDEMLAEEEEGAQGAPSASAGPG